MPDMSDVLAVILGGGQGKRLFPLTVMRSKPAVPIAGKYRLIDIPISNCINSDIYRIAVLTQFNSVSLHRHMSTTYNFDAFHHGFVQIWAAEQTMEHTEWYQGTADAVRKQIFEIRSARCDYVLILAGDHLYKMDYSKMAAFHWETGADVTVAVQPVPVHEASRLGILKRDKSYRITDFAEKPKDPEVLANMISRDDSEKPYLGSMGIYMFKLDTLVDVLSLDNQAHKLDDFGGDIIPHLIRHGASVYGYDFSGYWQDIGTIRSFYETNLALTEPNPPFDLFDQQFKIFTNPRFLPCAHFCDCRLKNVIVGEGCYIEKADIEHSVIGVRSRIKEGSRVYNTVMMGSDYYKNSGEYPLGIGKNCDIDGAIIDKNVSMGDNVVIRPFPQNANVDHFLYYVRDGVVIIPKNMNVPSGTVIKPEG